MAIKRKRRNVRFGLAFAMLVAMAIAGCTQPGGDNGGSSSHSTLRELQPPGTNPGLDPQALANLTVSVVDETGAPLAGGFRWLVERDDAYQTVPGVSLTETVGTGIHRSHRPTLSAGEEATDTADIQVPDDVALFISVLPLEEGWQMGGAMVAPGQTSVTITVVAPALPTAQISVYVFEDKQPLNSAPDVPAEPGLAGFSVIIHDFLGQQMMDAFGNMIGTTYMQNPDGSYILDMDGAPMVMMMGNGYALTDANGEALIKNLAPGKYGVIVAPPDGTDWILTSTIEGTPVVDAWVGHNGPPWFAEFGFFDWHCFYGFVHPTTLPPSGGATGTLHGQAVYVHDQRPPKQPGNTPGAPIPDAWVALNNLSGNDEMVYAQPCDPDTGEFTISNVPPGLYQLAIWDRNLDVIIDFRTVTVPPEGGTIEMGKVAAYGWFGRMSGSVFEDLNQNGYPDPGEAGVPDVAVNLRFADGSIYLSTVTNPTGEYCFNEIFPWFHFLITEIDFIRYKATGATIIVDDGGTVEPGSVLRPQPQPENGGLGWRTEIGAVLTQAMELMLDMTNVIHWGKANYLPGENGGISGVVYYASTRAENDPRLAALDLWEPGIPRVQVELYQDSDFDQVIDDLDTNAGPTRADVDNYPFGWLDGGTYGAEDVDRNSNGTFDPGDAIQIATTDSWDDSNPTGCVGPVQYVHGHTIRDCAETLATFNQVRPGVFDGGYAFGSYFPGGIAAGSTEVDGLPSGYYIVGVDPPPGYEIVKEEDKNVDFGEIYTPSPLAVVPTIGPPACVGDGHTVADQLTLFPGITTEAAGQFLPLCDMKTVLVKDGRNAAADFPLFTYVPKAAMGWGMVFDDVALEFDPNVPSAGSNMGVPWLPISIQDWSGREVVRVYTDEWGKYNVTLPATYSANVPAPSGVAPNMFNICLNHPGPIPDPSNPGVMITDPWYNPGYGRPCVFLNFYSGKTTFMDTPILPIAAFTPNKSPLDCEYGDGTPVINLVSGPTGGPYVATTGSNLTITSMGPTSVPNPDFDPTNPLSPATITRQFGFGGATGDVTINGNPLTVLFWNDAVIIATVPPGTTTGQLEVVKFDGTPSRLGVTVHVGGPQISEVRTVSAGESIQAQIDAAADNALILIGPGEYRETLLITKPIKLQGAGAYATKIFVPQLTPTEQLEWQAVVQALVNDGTIVLLPEQQDFFQQSGGGVLVSYPAATVTDPGNPPLIDGLQITGALRGGGIYLNTFVENLQISNNKIYSNEGNFGGGIRVGNPSIINETGDGYLSSENKNVNIHHNLIAQNGGIDGGGGVTLFNGSDNYVVTENLICGNFALLYGAGIDHFGLSNNGEISFNDIISNQSFDEGGGIMIAGELVPGGAPVGTLSEGSGSVMINSNVILGNMSGDDGGGIRALMTNGQDVQLNPSDPDQWHQINILNNLIVNNVSWDAGGGLSLDDSAAVNVINNTIAHNDATSNGVDAFAPCVNNVPPGTWCPAEGGGGLTTSVPQVAGIASRSHSLGLQSAFGIGFEQTFSDPALEDNIIYQNRSFYWDAAYNLGLGGLRPDIAGGEAPVYWDLAVYGTPAAEYLSPMSGILTDTTDYDPSNSSADPAFVDASYFNSFLITSSGTALGNFVVVTFKLPLAHGDYHLQAGSPAINQGAGLYLGTYGELDADIDGEPRPFGGGVDAGADEQQ